MFVSFNLINSLLMLFFPFYVGGRAETEACYCV